MSAREAIYDILQAESTVTDEIGTRLFMSFAPSETTKPFIVFRLNMIDDTFTKDRTSTVDKYLIEIDIYHNEVKDAESLSELIYAALQGYKGTINGNVVQGIRLDREEQDEDVDEYPIWSQDYELRIER